MGKASRALPASREPLLDHKLEGGGLLCANTWPVTAFLALSSFCLLKAVHKATLAVAPAGLHGVRCALHSCRAAARCGTDSTQLGCCSAFLLTTCLPGNSHPSL